jgi:hypothetical protein
MALALVKLSAQRNGKTHYFLDYISYEAAKLGVLIQGEEHKEGEYSKAEIVKVINNAKLLQTQTNKKK